MTDLKNTIEHGFDMKQIVDFTKLNIKFAPFQLPYVQNQQGKPRGTGYEEQTLERRLMLHCTVEFNMQIPADAITAVVLMALIAAQGRFVTEGYWKNPGRVGKLCLTLLVVGGAWYLGTGGNQRGKETYWLRKAKTERVSAEEALNCLKKAHDIEPLNPQTDYLLGESLRLVSKDANRGYKDKALEASEWFGRGMELNPFDARFPLRIGMCLDWIDRSKAATPYFDLAERLDTNNYYIALEVGRHFVALGRLCDGQNLGGKIHDPSADPGSPGDR